MTIGAAVLSFAMVAGVLTVIPGLDTALVLRAAIVQGRRRAAATAAGIGTGALVWGAAAAVGISALLTASQIAFTTVRIVGAGYLVLLGIRLLRSALRPAPPDPGASVDRPLSTWRCWQRGFLTNLLNPKVGAFYVAVLPQFLPAGIPHLAMGLLLAVVHVLESLLWFAVLILGAGAIRRHLQRRKVQRRIDGGTGVVLVGFGVALALGR
jgi:threonine/homoserine/homoserine lactone efflux protein